MASRLRHGGRAGQVRSQPPGQFGAQLLQPVPQRQRGPAVVLVVGGDDPFRLLGVPGGAVLQRRLEGDQVLGRLPQVHLPGVPAQGFQPLDRIALHPRPDALPHHPVQVDEHAAPEQVVHLVLTGGEAAHQPADGLLAGPVQLGEVVDRRRLVVVVVVDVQARVTAAPLGDEVDQFLERALLARPVERPDLGVARPAAGVGIGRVDDAEQVLQPELLVVLGVIPRPFDIEEQVTGCRNGQRQESPVDQERTRHVPFGIQKLVLDVAFVLAGHLQAGLQPGPARDCRLTPLPPGRRPGQPGRAGSTPRRPSAPAAGPW